MGKLRNVLSKGFDAVLLAGIVVGAVDVGMKLKAMFEEAECAGCGDLDCPLRDGSGVGFAELVTHLAENSDDAEEFIGAAVDALGDYAEAHGMVGLVWDDAPERECQDARCEFDPNKECCAYTCRAFDRDPNEVPADEAQQAQADAAGSGEGD